MNIKNEKMFYQNLGNVPAVPDDIFNSIESSISPKPKKRLLWSPIISVAAMIIFLATALFIHEGNPRDSSQTVVAFNETEFNKNLESFADYFDGETTENNYDTYALIDSNLFETDK